MALWRTLPVTDSDGATRRVAFERLLPSSAARGVGVTFVLVPGLGTIRGVYAALAPLLHDGGRNGVVTTDLRGMGGSAAGWRSYDAIDSARDVHALLAALDLRDVVLVGGSMAAASVAWAAAEDGGGGRVVGVVGLGPFFWDHKMPLGVPTLLSALLLDCWGAAAWASYYRTLFKLPGVAGLDAHVAAVKANLCGPGRLAALRGHLFSPKAPCAARLPELAARRLPLLALFGAADPDFPGGVDAELADLRGRVPHAEAAVLPGGGNYPMMEAPAWTAERLLAFAAAARAAPADKPAAAPADAQ